MENGIPCYFKILKNGIDTNGIHTNGIKLDTNEINKYAKLTLIFNIYMQNAQRMLLANRRRTLIIHYHAYHDKKTFTTPLKCKKNNDNYNKKFNLVLRKIEH